MFACCIFCVYHTHSHCHVIIYLVVYFLIGRILFDPFCQSLSLNCVFWPFTFKVITGHVRTLYFLFHICYLLFFCFLFPAFLGVKWTCFGILFLLIHAVFECFSLHNSVFVFSHCFQYDITYTRKLSPSADLIILPFQVEKPLPSLHFSTLLVYNCFQYFLHIHWKPHQAVSQFLLKSSKVI